VGEARWTSRTAPHQGGGELSAEAIAIVRIQEAFCLQLSRAVSIDEERVCLSAERNVIAGYAFVCAHPACRSANIRIIGVNYRIDAESGRKILENHFRRWDLHLPGRP
jgi:hypothetical protein